MKYNNWLSVITIVFFAIVNTSYFWTPKLGTLGIPVFIFFTILFFLLTLFLIREFIYGVKEKFIKKKRNWTIGLMVVLLGLIYIKPLGIINFDRLEGEDICVAEREGAANCMITLKLKSTNKFKETSVCFGVNEVKGNYEFLNDTIFFYPVSLGWMEKEYYKFALFKKSKYKNEEVLHRYRNETDTIGNELWITKNELIK